MTQEELNKFMIEEWKRDIISNQKWNILNQMPIIKNVTNIAGGILGVVY